MAGTKGTIPAIKSSGIICKGNVKDNYDTIPTTLYNYVELGLISSSEAMVYIRLYQYYNVEYGYAFPTIPQLMIMTGTGGKSTIDKALDNLVNVGLISKEKNEDYGNKNIYVVYKPLECEELYSIALDNVEQLEKKKKKLGMRAKKDKIRLQEYAQQQGN